MDGIHIAAIVLGILNGVFYAVSGYADRIIRYSPQQNYVTLSVLTTIGSYLINLSLLIMAIYGWISSSFIFGVSVIVWGWLLAAPLGYFIAKVLLREPTPRSIYDCPFNSKDAIEFYINTALKCKKRTPNKVKDFIKTPGGAQKLVKLERKWAEQISKKTQPTNKDFADMGLIGWSAAERKQMSDLIHDEFLTLAEETAAKTERPSDGRNVSNGPQKKDVSIEPTIGDDLSRFGRR